MQKRFLSIFIATLCLFTLLTTTAMAGFFSQYTKVKETNGEVLISLQSVNDGKAHHYVYKGNNQEVKFFVVKSSDGVIRAAFDACDVCFPDKKGYSQEGEFMICNKCGRKFHSNRINIVEGGCNPAPLKRVERGENLVITVADILQGTRFF